MGKNASADECVRCGNLIYYGGKNPCCNDYEPSDEEIQRWHEELEIKRKEAEQSILSHYKIISEYNAENSGVPFEEVLDIAQHDCDFHTAIWAASTEILPNLEVQVVIDGKNKCFVSTGSAGYVEFGLRPPIGMSLPIRCWIHTHPFGSAYFSGTDIRTVSIWETQMESAYVLGSKPLTDNGAGHYGFWTNSRPNELDIYRNGELERTQTWVKKGDEEE